jgi:hypothetical protein
LRAGKVQIRRHPSCRSKNGGTRAPFLFSAVGAVTIAPDLAACGADEDCVKSDARLEPQRRSQLDRLYERVIDDLDTLIQAVGSAWR